MTLIVENGTGRSDANAYVSLADCDAYHLAQGNSAWTAAVDVEKEAAIIKGTGYLNTRFAERWKGRRVNYYQTMAWPRYDVVDMDDYFVYGNVVPKRVVDACCEAALRALSEDIQPDLERKTNSETIGPIKIDYDPGSPQQTRYTRIEDLIRPYLRPRGRMVRG